MGQETPNVDPFTPAVTRVPLKLSPIRRNSKKALTQEMVSENEMLLLHLPEVPFVDDVQRLNRSCPLSFDSDCDSEDDDEPVDPFSSLGRRASFSNLSLSSSGGFLQPRTEEHMKDDKNKGFLQAALNRMSKQGGTKLAFHQSSRIPRRKTATKNVLLQIPEMKQEVAEVPKQSNASAGKTETIAPQDNGLKRRPIRRQNSATCA